MFNEQPVTHLIQSDSIFISIPIGILVSLDVVVLTILSAGLFFNKKETPARWSRLHTFWHTTFLVASTAVMFGKA